jgi:multiple sugar transport system permease protein/lactose/L-arabinose transport system permease protein
MSTDISGADTTTRQADPEPGVRDRIRFWRQEVRDTVPELPGVPYLFISPFFVLFGLFLAFPVVYTIFLSFFEYEGVSNETLLWIDTGFFQFKLTRMAELSYVGLDNYARLLGDSLFHQSIVNTGFIFLVQVPVMVGLALGLALALNASFMRFKGLFRTAIAIPVSANTAAYAVVFSALLAESGLVNTALTGLGFEPIPFLTDGFWARFTVIGAMTWRWTGYNMIILLAGLQNVPQQLYEAAEIDGANRFEKFRYVTVPQLRPVLLFVFVTSTIGSFRLFTEPFILVGESAKPQTQTIVWYIYDLAFQGSTQLGYASAVTWVLVLGVAALSVGQIYLGGDSDA